MKPSPADEDSSRMISAERLNRILALLQDSKTVSVSELSRLFAVSTNTIRRDLQQLAESGVVIRTHGGAVLASQSTAEIPFQLLATHRLDEKRRIAAQAVQMLEQGDTLILDAGTTIGEIAKLLKLKKGFTVITNAINVAAELCTCSDIVTIVAGGIIRTASSCLVGSLAKQTIAGFHADKLFLSTGGVDLEVGLTNTNTDEVEVKQAMIQAARERILVATHDKFDHIALAPFASLDMVDKVITDDGLAPEYAAALRSRGIEVILC